MTSPRARGLGTTAILPLAALVVTGLRRQFDPEGRAVSCGDVAQR